MRWMHASISCPTISGGDTHHYWANDDGPCESHMGNQGAAKLCTKAEKGATFSTVGCNQGATMLLQNHYQRQRLYTRIALGKMVSKTCTCSGDGPNPKAGRSSDIPRRGGDPSQGEVDDW